MNKQKISFIAAIAFIFIFFTAMKVEDVPKPNLAGGSFVVDSGHLLGPEYSALLSSLLRDVESRTTAELVVVTVDDLEGLEFEDFGEKLFKKYEIGKKGVDNGVLILVAQREKGIRIEVGYGLEGVLTDALTSQLRDEKAVPRFKNGEFGRGLYDLSSALGLKIANNAQLPIEISEPTAWPLQPPLPVLPEEGEVVGKDEKSGLGTTLLYVFMALFGVIVLWRIYSWNRCPKCKKRSWKSKATVLKAATKTETGLRRVDFACTNPACKHSTSKEETIAKVSSSGSSSSGGSSGSSGSSFGGGRSGGGGSTGKW